MQVLGVIPARYASTRFPGKMLAPILGKPMVLWVAEAASSAKLLDHIIVATDDERIADIAEHHGFDVIMTSPSCRNGTERVAEVAKKLHLYEILVNIQGDEPLITGEIIDKVVEDLMNTPEAGISTGYAPVESERQAKDPNTVKVVTDAKGFALYFSRSLIPYQRNKIVKPRRHIGIYAYRWEEVIRYSRYSPTDLEREENLEQLRALEYGARIHCVEIPEAAELVGVDVPEDITKVERILKRRLKEG